MSSADDGYMDADAPISDEEIAAAAVVLATVRGPSLDPALKRRCEADARAYFDARRKVRATTTTSGTEVIIEGAPVVDAARRRTKSRVWTAGWLAAAACVGLVVFFARSRPSSPTQIPTPATTAPATRVVSVGADGAIQIAGLARCTEGSRYVLTSRGADAGAAKRLAVFTETPFRHQGGVDSTGGELVVVLEASDGTSSVVGRWPEPTP